jgi:hypothetical protein
VVESKRPEEMGEDLVRTHHVGYLEALLLWSRERELEPETGAPLVKQNKSIKTKLACEPFGGCESVPRMNNQVVTTAVMLCSPSPPSLPVSMTTE